MFPLLNTNLILKELHFMKVSKTKMFGGPLFPLYDDPLINCLTRGSS